MNLADDPVLQYRPQVKAGLATALKAMQSSTGVSLAWPNDVAERLQTFGTSGKLLRGCLVCYSYQLVSGSAPTSAVINTAVAVELLHSALLIHDDIIDRDDLRRGRTAVHQQYSQLANRHGLIEAERFGTNMALCASDMILFLALGQLQAQSVNSSINTALSRLFSQTFMTVCAGQMEDIYWGLSAKFPAKRTIYNIMRAKTAAYTVALPLAAGAVLAEQSVEVQQHLYEIGLAGGIIFQIRDDELGAFGQTRQLGKPIGSDIREGKKTLLHYYLWRAATVSEKRFLRATYGAPDASSTDIAKVLELLQNYSIPAYLQQNIDQLTRTADKHIDQLKIDDKARQTLRSLVKLCAQRQT
jgi:geranylgeranyl diphosphate synthase, type I